MKKGLIGLGFVLTVIAAPMSALAAGTQDFTLHNKTGFTVHKVFIAESAANNWGDDVLGTGELDNGQSAKIHFTGYADTACKFDIRLEDESGKAWEIDGVDLCETNDIAVSKQGNGLAYTAE